MIMEIIEEISKHIPVIICLISIIILSFISTRKKQRIQMISNIIDGYFNQEIPKLPCMSCGNADNFGATLPLFLNGFDKPPKNIMICAECASEFLADLVRTVDVYLKEEP
jgi:hypothetical protein